MKENEKEREDGDKQNANTQRKNLKRSKKVMQKINKF